MLSNSSGLYTPDVFFVCANHPTHRKIFFNKLIGNQCLHTEYKYQPAEKWCFCFFGSRSVFLNFHAANKLIDEWRWFVVPSFCHKLVLQPVWRVTAWTFCFWIIFTFWCCLFVTHILRVKTFLVAAPPSAAVWFHHLQPHNLTHPCCFWHCCGSREEEWSSVRRFSPVIQGWKSRAGLVWPWVGILTISEVGNQRLWHHRSSACSNTCVQVDGIGF